MSEEINPKLVELYKKQRETLTKVAEEFKADIQKYDCSIYTCNATGCNSGGAGDVISTFTKCLEENKLHDRIRMVSTGCMGLCGSGPLAKIEIRGQAPVLYQGVDEEVAKLIFNEHILKALNLKEGEKFNPSENLKKHELSLDLPFFKLQKKIVLEHLGHSDPDNFAEYIALGGYSAFLKVIDTMTPEEVIKVMKDSGLRGRGGAGFPTGLKWEALSKVPRIDEKFIICNGDEGDPGAYMDACILGGGAHAVLEGMMIAAYATGSNYGWLYVRAEYPLAVQRVETAIKQAKKYGLLGKNILGSNFDFMAELRLGAGAFVCGEETALIASIEGKRGYPSPRPPYPTEYGLWGKPSSINNVETFANVPKIIRNGADWFKQVGTASSKGTKVFALTGKIKHGGLVEIPMGTTLGTMVNEIGGGTPCGKPYKAVQTGGPSGGIIPSRFSDLEICYDKLKEIGSMMGSGGMIVMDPDDSIVEIAKFYLGFAVDESCGKCAPCRLGGYQMLKLLTRVAEGKGSMEDIDKIKSLANTMKKASLCGLGQTAPNPVISSLRYFEEEYMALINGEKKEDEKEPSHVETGKCQNSCQACKGN